MNLPDNIPKTISEIESQMKFVKFGGFSVYKADYIGGSIWTPANSDRGKIFHFYNKKLNSTGSMTRSELEVALTNFNKIIDNVKQDGANPSTKSVTKQGEFNFTPILLFAGAVLLLLLIFGFGGNDE